MERLVFHRSDVESILKTVHEAGRALARQQPDLEFLNGYATALRLTTAAFGCPELLAELPAARVSVPCDPEDCPALPAHEPSFARASLGPQSR